MKKYLLLLLLLLSSCRTQYVVMPSSHSRDSLSTRVNTYVDSTFIDRNHTEKLHVGSDPVCSFEETNRLAAVCSFRVDTLFIKDSIYIEKLRYLSLHDTLRIIARDSIPYPVEVPIEVEKPIPRFYRTCTLGFFLILLCIILALVAYVFLRIYLRR